MRLGSRFFLSHAVVAALTLGACMGLSHQAARWLFQREETRRQAQMLADFSQAAKEAVFKHEDLGLIQEMRALLSHDPSLVFVSFYNPANLSRLTLPMGFAGEAWRGGEAGASAAPLPRTLSGGAGVLDWSAPLRPRFRASAWVELVFSVQSGRAVLERQMEDWDKMLAFILLAGILVAAALGWLMARRMVRPLLDIGRGARMVRSGSLDHIVQAGRGDEIGDLAREFNGMVLQLKELDAMKRDFVAGVTHDFGGPLHAINTTIVHLLSGKAGPLGERHAEYLLMISNNLANLTDFVNNLLTVARIEAAKVEPYVEPVDVAGHVGDLMKLYEAEALRKNLDWSLVKASPYLSLEADVTMFRQIVMNLLSNALKFTDQGGIELTLKEEGDDLLIRVKDSGVGIAPAHHALIFDKFFRVRQDGDPGLRQGSGLGLAIAKGLAEAHGGSISVESSPGSGACFTVRLPKQPFRTKSGPRDEKAP